MSQHIIVGAGINGLFTAYYLMQAGEKVTLIDQREVGKESSWAGGGILSPLYPWRYPAAVTNIVRWSQQRYPDIIADLHSATGIDPEYLQSGLLVLDTSEAEQATEWANKYNQSIKLLDKENIEEISANIRAPEYGGMLMRNVGQVRNPLLVKSLQMYLKAGGVTILEHEKCSQLIIENHRVVGIVTNKQRLMGDTVCLCAGAWTSTLLRQTDTIPAIEPVKGQMLLLQSQPDLVNHIVLGKTHYVIPRKDGLVLVGSTVEYVGFDKTTTQQAKRTLESFAYALIPKLQQAKLVRHWSGLRPGSSKGIPTLCCHPEVAGLYINSGQYRNGVVMAPGSGNFVANLMMHRPSNFRVNDYKLASADSVSAV